ncbi:MAG: ACT domain-containing protein, partial [Actinomycetota bacterium]
MPTEIAIETEDRPGILAEIGELFEEADVDVLAAAAFTHQGRGQLHFVVDDADHALGTLKRANYRVFSVHEVLSLSLDDRPGELGRLARKLADAGVNILSFYTTGMGPGDK